MHQTFVLCSPQNDPHMAAAARSKKSEPTLLMDEETTEEGLFHFMLMLVCNAAVRQLQIPMESINTTGAQELWLEAMKNIRTRDGGSEMSDFKLASTAMIEVIEQLNGGESP